MKTTIHGFRQDRLVLYGMDNDDALILSLSGFPSLLLIQKEPKK